MDLLKHILRLYDRDLMRTSQNYNLELPRERLRSVRELENLLMRITHYCKPDCFIEAGAKDASVSEKVREFLPDARIVAFEANPHTYSKFKSHSRMKNSDIEYVHKALSEKVGPIGFSLKTEIDGVAHSKTRGDGSLLTPNLEHVKVETHTVEATTLDSFFSGMTKDAYIWVDVEGATEQVLCGGDKLFRENIGAALIEVEDREMWSGQWLSNDVNMFMFERGFTPIARDFQSRYQYNILYIHERVVDIDYVRYRQVMHGSLSGARKTV